MFINVEIINGYVCCHYEKNNVKFSRIFSGTLNIHVYMNYTRTF